MKVILTGCTGFIGTEVLTQCLGHPGISSIIALSRRPLPSTPRFTNPKLKVVILQDFTTYPDSILEEIRGAEGCIWAIGTFIGDTVVDIDYPLAFCNAMIQQQPAGEKFRYVHLGGGFTEPPDSERNLWYYAKARRVRGKAESDVLAFAQEPEHRERWVTCVVKPGAVLAKGGCASAVLPLALGSQWAIRGDELAAVMIEMVVSGVGDQVVHRNAEIVRRGKGLLAKR